MAFVGKNRWTSDLTPWLLDDDDDNDDDGGGGGDVDSDHLLFVHSAISEKTDTLWFLSHKTGDA
jgi:hypothetical protein